jgi:hypothetical protein
MRPNPREMTHALLEVQQYGRSRPQNATAENVVIILSHTVTLWVHSSNDNSNLERDYERYNRISAPPRSVRHYMKQFCARLNILNIQLFLPKEKCPVQSWIWVVAERPSGRESLWFIGSLTVKPRITPITQMFFGTTSPIAQPFVGTIAPMKQMSVGMIACIAPTFVVLWASVAETRMHEAARYKIAQNPVGRVQISVRHDYIK